MSVTRRTFFKIGAGGGVISILGFDLQLAHAQSRELKISRTTETRSTCPYCAVSCGVIIHTLGDKAKNVTPQDISWEQAYSEIAERVKKTRDDTFVEKDGSGKTVNRCEGIAFTGGCTDTNEFNYLVVKTMRSLGVCYLENQARV